MIAPFLGIEDTLRVIDLAATNVKAQDVSVLILDLCEIAIDRAFGQVAMARCEDAAARCGLELLLTGVTAPSEAILAEDAHCPQIFSNIKYAVAAALQIARSQQELL